jgi:electron transport complex protein RnfB
VGAPAELLAQALNDALPQTQCTRCGYPNCQSYASAIASELADINQCPPGGREGVDRLASLTGRRVLPLNPLNGAESPRLLAIIDEAWCIGCTLCLKACPVDCIVGGPKLMHTVIESQCTGCELCIPACPVDCIALAPACGDRTGWQSWSQSQAAQARERYAWHQERTLRDASEYEQRLEASAQAVRRDPGTGS